MLSVAVCGLKNGPAIKLTSIVQPLPAAKVAGQRLTATNSLESPPCTIEKKGSLIVIGPVPVLATSRDIAGERTVVHSQSSPGTVNAAAVGSGGGVRGEGTVLNRQCAAVVVDATTLV